MEKNFGVFRFKKGIGNEIIAVGAVLLFVAMLIGVMTWYGGYTASIEGQIVSDVIADGSVAFAKVDMEIYEDALRAMAKKLFEKNKELINGLGMCSISGYSVTVNKLYSTRATPPLFNQDESNWLNKRTDIKSGTLTTAVFKFSIAGLYGSMAGDSHTGISYDQEVMDDLLDHDSERGVNGSHMTGKTFGVRYSGPAYNDEVVNVSVSSHANVPVIGKQFTRTGTSSVLARANVAYNSRYGARGMMTTLEQQAYKGVMDGDTVNVNSGKLPVMGSIQQKAMLNAMRYIKDGYFRGGYNSLNAWPKTINPNGDGTFLGDSATRNEHKDCYNFVSAAYSMGGNGQSLSVTLGQYPNSEISREVELIRVISASTIWEEMHKFQTINLTTKTRRALELFNEARDELGWSHKSTAYFATSTGYWGTIGSNGNVVILRDKNGKCSTADYDYVGNGFGGQLVPKDPGLSLAEAMATYAPDSDVGDNAGSKLWRIGKMQTWTEGDLRPGDVLIFINPNWQPIVAKELIQIFNMEEKDEAALAALDNPSGRGFVSHFALYLGNGMIAESTTRGGKNGGQINPLRGLTVQGNVTSVIKAVYRFDVVSWKKVGSGGSSGTDVLFDDYEENASN